MNFQKMMFALLICFLTLSNISAQEFNIDMHSGVPFAMDYKLPQSFIFSTAAPHYFYTIPMPPDCLNIGEIYGDVLTGYENYFPCVGKHKDPRSIFYVELGDSNGVFPKDIDALFVPAAEFRSFNSKNTDGPNFDYVVTKDFIEFSKYFSSLERLALVNHKIDSLEGLGRLEHLKYLELSVSYIEDWSSITELQQVETLNLACSNIQNKDLEHIAKLKIVKTLVLDGTDISDVSALSEMQNLQNLLLKVTNISELEELEVLKPLQLRWISFDPIFSRKALSKSNPHVEPTRFVTAQTLKPEIGIFIDTQYPAKNCNETIYQPVKVW